MSQISKEEEGKRWRRKREKKKNFGREKDVKWVREFECTTDETAAARWWFYCNQILILLRAHQCVLLFEDAFL